MILIIDFGNLSDNKQNYKWVWLHSFVGGKRFEHLAIKKQKQKQNKTTSGFDFLAKQFCRWKIAVVSTNSHHMRRRFLLLPDEVLLPFHAILKKEKQQILFVPYRAIFFFIKMLSLQEMIRVKMWEQCIYVLGNSAWALASHSYFVIFFYPALMVIKLVSIYMFWQNKKY